MGRQMAAHAVARSGSSAPAPLPGGLSHSTEELREIMECPEQPRLADFGTRNAVCVHGSEPVRAVLALLHARQISSVETVRAASERMEAAGVRLLPVVDANCAAISPPSAMPVAPARAI